jgi:hypothetical protein
VQRRKFSRQFLVEAVKLVGDRGSRWLRPPGAWTLMRTFCANGTQTWPLKERNFSGFAALVRWFLRTQLCWWLSPRMVVRNLIGPAMWLRRIGL